MTGREADDREGGRTDEGGPFLGDEGWGLRRNDRALFPHFQKKRLVFAQTVSQEWRVSDFQAVVRAAIRR